MEILTTGDFPGDGKQKPAAFPHPSAVRREIDGVQFVELPVLIELKLASGMTNPARLRDLADVQELARELGLSEAFARELDPYVRLKIVELVRDLKRGDPHHESPAQTWATDRHRPSPIHGEHPSMACSSPVNPI